MENLLKDKPDPVGKVLENVGYSETLAEQPNRIILSEGFQTALAETGLKEALIKQGINPEKIAEKINVLLNATIGENEKPDVNAIDKGLKHAANIYGIVDPSEKPKLQNTYNFIFSTETQEKVRLINEEIKAKLINAKTD